MLLLGCVFAISMATASLVIPSPVGLMEPGPALEIGPLISVGGEVENDGGMLYLASVAVRTPTMAQLASALLDPSVKIVPRDDFQPLDIPPEEFQRIQRDLLEESKTTAKIVALRELGHDVKIAGHGARVEAILPGSPVEGKLESGDTIVEIDGRELETASELQEAVRRVRPGEEVGLVVVTGDSRIEMRSDTMESTFDPGQAMLSVMVTTRRLEYSLPFEVRVDTQNLGGPSAGLMFTLGIIDTLTPGDLTNGHKVAGTGTIAIDGTVGEIEGVRQKVIGAQRAGAEFFLAPAENYAEARGAARGIEVVSVRHPDEALSFLSTLQSEPQALSPAVSPPLAIRWVPTW